ncbi:DUF5694 domain-containing protein [Winogradskyella psychrotolerans]|uniref:DUF5694 domain-containing protein n=1 Tax=Winogradskyella psychrotolerans TaxID=1344585 RepID=UPI001C07A7CD|nr:DUF5694 domain-containing protein [Winogradskyella psychrotolerans]MBU2929052.1 hypothetical protein [Winogradskyella psychrotolerans]
MRTLFTFIIVLFISIVIGNAQEAQKEVLIVGTMHTVPNIVKNSYKPMLKRAKLYNPTAIYVESPRGKDTLSWDYLKDGWSKNYKAFYYLSDSIKNNFSPNVEKYNDILNKSFSDMTTEDLDFMITTFAYHRDNANHEFYSYIKKHGIDGSKKPTQHEDGDLTFKLALHQNIKLLTSMDDQQTNGDYHDAWSKCSKEGQSNGNNAINSKMNKKAYNSAIVPAIFRGLGKHTNKRRSLEQLHQSSSFTYVAVKTEGCTEGEIYWNERNMRMAKNIGDQVMRSNSERNIVVVGASHVIGLEKELQANYPELKIVLVGD